MLIRIRRNLGTLTKTMLIILAFSGVAQAQSESYSLVSPQGEAVTQVDAELITLDSTTPGQVTKADGLGVLPFTPVAEDFYLFVLGQNIIPAYFYEADWSPRKLIVSTVASQNTVDLKGTTKGFAPQNLDGEVDCAAVVGALRKSDVLAFDLRKILSPESDPVQVNTFKMQLPANITLPKQTELYVIPFTLNKPNFRLTLAKEESTTLFTLQGHFNLSTVVSNAMAGSNQFYNMLNALKLTGGSLKTFPASSLQRPLDLAVNEIKFSQAWSIAFPTWGANQTVLALALNQVNGFYLPSDIKIFNKMQARANLNYIPKAYNLTAFVLKNQNELDPAVPGLDRLSLQLVHASQTPTAFIPLMKTPSLNSVGELVIDLPARPTELKTVRQVIHISKGSMVDENGKLVRKWQRVLEIWSPEWRNTVAFPKPLAELCEACRIDVSLMGTTEETVTNDELQWIEKANHVSHVSLELQ